MSKSKKKRHSIFAVLIVIVLLLVVAGTVVTNVIFSGDNIPEVAGYYLYLHREADMEPDIPQNSLVFAKAAPNESLAPGAVVLCYLSDRNVALRNIYDITVSEEDGSTNYFPGTALEQGSELAIPRENIFAICTRASKELFSYVTFATSVSGLMALLVVPCVILIVMLLVKIAKSSEEELSAEDFAFDEKQKDAAPRKPKEHGPLFDPEQSKTGSVASIEKKKTALEGNFTVKPVNENSPYQKAVKERTMKFNKVQEEDIERARQEAAHAAPSRSPEPSPRPASAPPKPAPMTGAPSQRTAPSAQEEKPAYVPAHAKLPEDEAGARPAQKTVADQVPAAARTSAPNIDDILRPEQVRASREGKKLNPSIAATSSIDDLIAALEKEEKKL